MANFGEHVEYCLGHFCPPQDSSRPSFRHVHMKVKTEQAGIGHLFSTRSLRTANTKKKKKKNFSLNILMKCKSWMKYQWRETFSLAVHFSEFITRLQLSLNTAGQRWLTCILHCSWRCKGGKFWTCLSHSTMTWNSTWHEFQKAEIMPQDESDIEIHKQWPSLLKKSDGHAKPSLAPNKLVSRIKFQLWEKRKWKQTCMRQKP